MVVQAAESLAEIREEMESVSIIVAAGSVEKETDDGLIFDEDWTKFFLEETLTTKMTRPTRSRYPRFNKRVDWPSKQDEIRNALAMDPNLRAKMLQKIDQGVQEYIAFFNAWKGRRSRAVSFRFCPATSDLTHTEAAFQKQPFDLDHPERVLSGTWCVYLVCMAEAEYSIAQIRHNVNCLKLALAKNHCVVLIPTEHHVPTELERVVASGIDKTLSDVQQGLSARGASTHVV